MRAATRSGNRLRAQGRRSCSPCVSSYLPGCVRAGLRLNPEGGGWSRCGDAQSSDRNAVARLSGAGMPLRS
eukprot:5404448-Prymnesium_polylepis.1